MLQKVNWNAPTLQTTTRDNPLRFHAMDSCARGSRFADSISACAERPYRALPRGSLPRQDLGQRPHGIHDLARDLLALRMF